jgi:nucleotide-binding universal stress UspA family protein
MKLDDLKMILVPTDFSEASTFALEAAVIMAQKFQAAIEIFHVDLDPVMVLPPPVDILVMPISVENSMARTAEKLDRLVAEVTQKNIVCTGFSESGRTHVAIVEHAARIGAGMIVMGSHGHHGLGHIVLGSVAEKVVQNAPCPVLVIPVAIKT